MKKLLFLVGIMLTMLVVNTNAQIYGKKYPELSITSQTGYSLINGVVGAEIQVNHFAVSVGYFPYDLSSFDDMKESGSTSLAVSWYSGDLYGENPSGVFESGLYVSLGMASKTYDSFDYYHKNPLPMGLVTTGFKVLIMGYGYMKVGVGLGYNSRGFEPSGEATFGFMLTWY